MVEKSPISEESLSAHLKPYHALLGRYACKPSTLIHIEPSQQRLRLVCHGKETFTCSVSTSRLGLGEELNSHQTPRGLHRVCSVIGQGQPSGRVFRSRRARADCWPSDTLPNDDDLILSRILWLEGMEAGKNRGGSVDTRSRYIYLHGTNHEHHIGSPASAGCIRLKNQDIIQLADQWMEPGVLCLIEG